MKQKNILQQGLKQVQKLLPQQVLEVRILELSTEELLQRIDGELLENEALEKGSEEDPDILPGDEPDGGEEDYRISDDVLRDPEDDYDSGETIVSSGAEDRSNWQIRAESSFNDELMVQLNECSVEEHEHQLVEYLIGSLEDSGLLDKDLQQLADELLLYVGVEATVEELEQALKLLQSFEPAGIGARNLQECLLLQIDRLPKTPLRALERRILQECYTELCNNHWEKIVAILQIDRSQLAAIRKDLARLNPRPGGSLAQSGPNTNAILPDFLLTVDDNQIQVQLNNAIVPQLHVSESYQQAMQLTNSQKKKLSQQETDQLTYIKDKVERAQNFIQAIRQRHTTLISTMRAIVDRQKEYFLTGDDSLLRPLAMKDVAAVAGVDISTVSRVCNSKYVQTPYGTYPLKHYFVERFQPKKEGNQDEDISMREIRDSLKQVIEAEDKNAPFSDQQLVEQLAQKGYTLARRTVAKYREQMNIPGARYRKIE